MIELVVTIGMFLGIPLRQEIYRYESMSECRRAKAEYIKDAHIGNTKYTIICVKANDKEQR